MKYGPQYTKQFAYYLAFIQFLYLIAYFGYWKENKWGIYLYIAALVLSILVRNYSFGISINAKDTAWHVFVIVYGFIYMSNNIENKL